MLELPGCKARIDGVWAQSDVNALNHLNHLSYMSCQSPRRILILLLSPIL